MTQGIQQLLTKARSLVQQYTAKQLYPTAAYWADKAHTLSNGDPNDLASYIQALYHCKEYQRASYILQNSPLLNQSSSLRYLAARCYAACEEWEDVLYLLSPPSDLPDHTPPVTPTPTTKAPSTTDDLKIASLGNIESASLVLKGQAHEKLGDLPSAVECYKQALAKDVYCVEALERLSQHHTLNTDEEKVLVKSLPLKVQCDPLEGEMVQFLYLQQLHHSGKSTPPSSQLADLRPLSSSVDVMSNVADAHFKQVNLDACYQLTSAILERDPYHSHTLLLHVACCVQMNKFEVLFSLGHTLVNSAPNSALSWYVVGCYYMSINKHQNARKYFTKAITLEPNFGHTHIAFGLSFAAEGEHDQAISAFSSAARIMRGSHLPLLYLGKEYHQTGVTATSTRFMKRAFDLYPHDPCLLQEIGYIMTSKGEFRRAERYFKQAISHLQQVDSHMTLPAWEPIYNNLGHVLRKQERFEEALQAHHDALQLQPSNPSTLTAIAFVHLLMEDYDMTVEYAHESLKRKREDQFTLEVLHTAMTELSERPFVAALPDLGCLREESEIHMILKAVGDTKTRHVQGEDIEMCTD